MIAAGLERPAATLVGINKCHDIVGHDLLHHETLGNGAGPMQPLRKPPMTRPSPDLPRMQNQSRTRAPFGQNLNSVSQQIGKAGRSSPALKSPMMRQYDL